MPFGRIHESMLNSTEPGAPARSGRAILREAIAHTAVTFLSTLAIQIVTFGILALSALILPAEGFARLSVIVAVVMLSSALFEFGVNVTSTKMFSDTGDVGYFRSACFVRIACVPIASAFGAIAGVFGWTDIGLGIALGAALNIWNGLRATDQARQSYKDFIRSSLVFASIRACVGFAAAYLVLDPISIAIAMYAVPIVACMASSSSKYLREAFYLSNPTLLSSSGYAFYVYINAVAFIAVPYVPQFFIAARMDAISVGTYGLILSFSGPVGLLIYALYSTLLPKILDRSGGVEKALWSSKGVGVLCLFWLLLMSGGCILVFVLQSVYGDRFPNIAPIFLVYFAGTAASSLLGMYSLSVHTQGIPQLSAFVSVVRLIALVGALMAFGKTLMSVIVVTLVVLVLGQLALIALLWRRRLSSKTL